MLERFEWAGLTCKPPKCDLFAQSVEYLGHICGTTGVRMDPKKIEAVKGIIPSTICTLEKVRAFLGLTGYYRKHIKGYSNIALPLTELTKKDVDVEKESQTPTVQKAIETLKEALVSDPVLAYPRHDREFIVKTDAATGHGIGGVIVQKDDPDEKTGEVHERPVGYFGRKMTDAEKNYNVTECELLAALETIKQYRYLLWGRKFTLVTDHAALRWLHTLKETQEGGPASRITRWIMKLQEYDFTVEHKPGRHHQDADAVSRLVCSIEPSKKPLEQRDPTERLVAALSPPASPPKPDAPRVVSQGEGREREERVLTGIALHQRNAKLKKQRDAAVVKLVTDTWGKVEPGTTVSYQDLVLDVSHRFRKMVDEATDDSDPRPRVASIRPVEAIFSPMGSKEDCGDEKGQLRLQQEQEKDPLCVALKEHLQVGSIPQGKLGARVRSLGPRAELHDGVLYRRGSLLKDGDQERVALQAIIPPSLQQAYLHAFHDQLGHRGRETCWNALRRVAFWPKMFDDVNGHIARCHECCMTKGQPRQGSGVVPEVGAFPFDGIVVDLVDMKKHGSKNGYVKLAVMVDSLSRWVEAIPLKHDPTKEEMIDIFVNHIYSRYGIPRWVRSDRGGNLASKLTKAVNDATGTQMILSKSHHHASAGAVERFHQTLIDMIRAYDDGGERWDE